MTNIEYRLASINRTLISIKRIAVFFLLLALGELAYLAIVAMNNGRSPWQG